MAYWFGILVLLLGIAFGVQNPLEVSVVLAVWQLQLPLSVLMLITLTAGILLGWLFTHFKYWFKRKPQS